MKRISPVRMPLKAEKTEIRNYFEVKLSYQGETSGPSLVDLSHISKWEIETSDLDKKMNDINFSVPLKPCDAFLSKKKAVCRLTSTRVLIWDFDGRDDELLKQSGTFNDLTDGNALFFLTGEGLLSIMERLVEMDLDLKNQSDLLFLQGPVIGVPAKILVCINQQYQMGMFISVGRGFGQSIADAILAAGAETDISPAGEYVFSRWSGR